MTQTPPTHPEASPPLAIEIDRLTHRYAPPRRRPRHADAPPTTPALDGVSFSVSPGEIFGVLGPNGGGKTTLFGILATMLAPTAGQARIFGYDVDTDPAAVRQRLGVVFQSPSLDAKLTARENLLHHGRLYGLRGADLADRADRWLSRVGLTDRQHERVERFSGGMRRRAELAKALLHDPPLLLMDEPATGLDPAARRELWGHLETLRRERGTTIVMTTHLMDEAERCDRVALLAAGRLVAVDRPAALRAQVGGQVVLLEPILEEGPAADAPADTRDTPAERLARFVTERYGPWDAPAQPRVVGGVVRFEHHRGGELVGEIASAWPSRLRKMSVQQPGLEDVFLHLTGAATSGDPQAAPQPASPVAAP